MFVDYGILYNCILFFFCHLRSSSSIQKCQILLQWAKEKNMNSQEQHLQKHISVFSFCMLKYKSKHQYLSSNTRNIQIFFFLKDSEPSKRELLTLSNSLSKVQQSGMKNSVPGRTCDTIPLNSNCQRKGGIVPFLLTKNAVLRMLQPRNSTSVPGFSS